MSRYHCKFKWAGSHRYGIVDEYSKDAKEAAKKQGTVIECSVGPERFIIPNELVTDIKDRNYKNCKLHEESGIFWGGGEAEDFVSLCQIVATIREQRLPKTKQLMPDQQFGVSVGDGSANYVVVKVMKVNCDVAWRGWCADRYYDHHFGCGGRFKVNDVKRYVGMAEAGRTLFGGNQTRADKSPEHFKELKKDWEKRYGKLPQSEFLAL